MYCYINCSNNAVLHSRLQVLSIVLSVSGAGKTYTMLGTDDEPGIMAQALNDLFTEMANTVSDMTYSVTMSYLEVVPIVLFSVFHIIMFELIRISYLETINFYPTPLRAVGVLFSPMVSGWAGRRQEKVCPGCISETVRCRKLILCRDIG